jgi:hypothetical protein
MSTNAPIIPTSLSTTSGPSVKVNVFHPSEDRLCHTSSDTCVQTFSILLLGDLFCLCVFQKQSLKSQQKLQDRKVQGLTGALSKSQNPGDRGGEKQGTFML